MEDATSATRVAAGDLESKNLYKMKHQFLFIREPIKCNSHVILTIRAIGGSHQHRPAAPLRRPRVHRLGRGAPGFPAASEVSTLTSSYQLGVGHDVLESFVVLPYDIAAVWTFSCNPTWPPSYLDDS